MRYDRFIIADADNIFLQHHDPVDWRDRTALRVVKFTRFFADQFFAQRDGPRAVVLETVAAGTVRDHGGPAGV